MALITKTHGAKYKPPINDKCIYCLKPIGNGNSDKDHLFGKSMFRPGVLNGKTNYKFKVHKSCNQAKSKLESSFTALMSIPTIACDPNNFDTLKTIKKLKGTGTTIDFSSLVQSTAYGVANIVKTNVPKSKIHNLCKLHIQGLVFAANDKVVSKSDITIGRDYEFYTTEGHKLWSVLSNLGEDVFIKDVWTIGDLHTDSGIQIQCTISGDGPDELYWIILYNKHNIILARSRNHQIP